TKISHSAMPRNRSSRSSRSPATGSVIAGAETAAASVFAWLALVSPRGVPAIGSAMDVIWHRLAVGHSRLRRPRTIISARKLHTRHANRYEPGRRAVAL